MRSNIFLYILFLVTACATMLPAGDRRAEFIEQTGVPKKTAYQRTLAHLAKSLGNSNSAIRLQDQETAHIVTKLITPKCEPLKASILYGDFVIEAVLDIEFKDSRAKYTFEDLVVLDAGTLAPTANVQFYDTETVEKAKACLKEQVATLVSAISRKPAASSDW